MDLAFRLEHPPTSIDVTPNNLVEVRALTFIGVQKADSTSNRLAGAEKDPAFDWVREDVTVVNEMAARHTSAGCRPPSWNRIFMGGPLLYGKWHAKGRSYQVLSKTQRAAILIDGHPVVELNIRASSVTILAAIKGVSRPVGDPYEVPGIPRDVAKQFVVVTLGSGQVPAMWPSMPRKTTRYHAVVDPRG